MENVLTKKVYSQYGSNTRFHHVYVEIKSVRSVKKIDGQIPWIVAMR